MTGSVAIDVVIGLVFIYLLYSLLVTVLVEIIATILQLRAKNLHKAICRMLDDGKTKIFSDKFYKQPLIKYLASGSFNIFNKPSYLNPESFSKALVDTLKSGSSKSNPLGKIKDGISDIPLDSDTRNHLESLLEDANNDLQKFKIMLENWFDDTMERSVGWYKKKTQLILLIVGFCIAVIFNASTFQIIKKLSKDEDAREQMVKLATAYVQENPDIIGNLDSMKKLDPEFRLKIDTLLRIRDELRRDMDEANTIVDINWPGMDSIEIVTLAQNKPSKGKIRKLSKTMIVIPDNDATRVVIYPSGVIESSFTKALKKDSLDDTKIQINKANTHVFFNKYRYFWSVFLKNFFGYLVTALAISLGAPFWFDLLNKFVKLRSSLAKPIQSGQAQTVANPNE